MKNTETKETSLGNKNKMCIFLALVFLGICTFLAINGFHFLAVDDCLDSGGRWSEVLNACEMSEQAQ